MTNNYLTSRAADTPASRTGVKIVANMTLDYNGVKLNRGALVRCPRCERVDNWALEGHSGQRHWECFHGSVEGVPFLADIVTLPEELAW